MQIKENRHRRIITLFIVVVALIGLVLIISDWEEFRQVLSQADWRYLPLVLLFTFLSYGFYSYSYAVVARTIGIQMRKVELAEVCFISTVVNHVIATAGVVGYSLRYMLMKMYNVYLKDVLTSSFLHMYITSLDMLIFLPICFTYLLQHSDVPRGIGIALGLMTLLFGLALIISTVLVVFPSRRRPIISLLARYGHRFLRHEWLAWLIKLDETLTCGSVAFARKPFTLLGVMMLTAFDFACSITAMGFVFEALGPAIPTGVLITGYVIGIMVGVLSMVPGGLGVQEVSMATIYAMMGVQFEQALLAAILFRLMYYFIPYLLILPFYNRLLQKAKQQEILEN